MRTRLLAAATTLAGLTTLPGLLATTDVNAQDAVQVGGAPARGQGSQAPATPLTFEVASVKPNRTAGGMIQIGIQPGGRLNASNVTVRELIRIAYQIQPFQIVGGPSWLSSDRFDIQAKAETDFQPGPPPTPGGPPGPVQQMLQALLRERFQLAVHNETRDMPIYDLVVAQRDGRLGPSLKASSLDCAGQLGARGRGQAPPANAAGVPGCGMRIGPGALSGNGIGMTFLANSLSQMVQRIVVDKTGLMGNYEFEVTFTPDQQQPGPPPGAGAPPLPIDPNGPSIYTAVQEQLGLKLESARGPVSVLVIDKIETPSPD
jgi:uncharacterized protein (TIGR03435 family)